MIKCESNILFTNEYGTNSLSILCRPDNPDGDKVIRYLHLQILFFTYHMLTVCFVYQKFHFIIRSARVSVGKRMNLYHETYLFFSIPKDIAQLNLTVEKAPRQDIMFMKKVRFVTYIIYCLLIKGQTFKFLLKNKENLWKVKL